MAELAKLFKNRPPYTFTIIGLIVCAVHDRLELERLHRNDVDLRVRVAQLETGCMSVEHDWCVRLVTPDAGPTP